MGTLGYVLFIIFTRQRIPKSLMEFQCQGGQLFFQIVKVRFSLNFEWSAYNHFCTIGRLIVAKSSWKSCWWLFSTFKVFLHFIEFNEKILTCYEYAWKKWHECYHEDEAVIIRKKLFSIASKKNVKHKIIKWCDQLNKSTHAAQIVINELVISLLH